MGTEETNEGVELDQLSKSLDTLLQLAGDDSLNKGYSPGSVAVSHSGTHGSGGMQGGGLAGTSEQGSTESLMIAKMIDQGTVAPLPGLVGLLQGVDASALGDGLSAGYMHGYLHGKAGESMNIGDGHGESYVKGYNQGFLHGQADGGFTTHQRPEPSKKSESSSESEPLRKSHLEQLLGDPDVQSGVDASDFMEALTKGVSSALDAMDESLQKSSREGHALSKATATAVYQLGTLLKSQAAAVNELNRRLGLVERQPAPAKGATTLTQASTMVKGMPGEAGPGSQKLSKSEVASTLTYMNLQKGIRELNGRRTGELASLAEAGGVIDQTTYQEVVKFLTSNPAEAEQARAYH